MVGSRFKIVKVQVLSMSESLWYHGRRKIRSDGDSVIVTLPRKELETEGIDVEDLIGEQTSITGRGGSVEVDIPGLTD